ncbi:MAG: hypothetical protein JO060_10990 [Candidatus Eremiobacteraeota bacterium]|nr:hypothetical protein [Candidatus Eremiobacteraeota bacterium]MBV9647413.1 hypothetical protein [Candidatus Eremiobacteraeota bacterium]
MKATLLAFAVAGLCAASSSAAGNYAVVYDFTGQNDGSFAHTSVVFDTSGNAYATTVMGGAQGCGTVDQFSPMPHSKWKETTLYTFICGVDGKNPYGGVTIGPDGSLYGVTAAGGSSPCTGDGCGVVYAVRGKGETVLHDFTGTNGDGFGPGNAPVFDSAGNLYGSTPDGGRLGFGIVYELSPKGLGWQEHIIHTFTGKKDGAVGSKGPLLIDASGNIYGVTEQGGNTGCGGSGCGVAFKMSLVAHKWTFKTLYVFSGAPNAQNPYGGLIMDHSGNLYGTTYYGGTGSCVSVPGCGTVYELSPGKKGQYTERLLHSFMGGSDGSATTTTLLMDNAGNLYGTTSMGGRPTCDCGTAFELRAPSWKESILHRFGKNKDGSYPYYGFTAFNGHLYSSTSAGGTFGQGTLFQI